MLSLLLLVYLHTPPVGAALKPHCMRYVNGAPHMVECRFRRKHEKVGHNCKIPSLKEG